MAASAKLRRGLEPHRFQVVPAGGIVRHGDPVIVAQADARVFEHAPDRRVKLPRYLGLRVPNRLQDRRDVDDGDLMHRAAQQGPAVGWASVARPLISDLGVRRFALRLLDHDLRDVLERGNRLGGFLGCRARIERVDVLRNQFPGIGSGDTCLRKRYGGIRTESHVAASAIHLEPQNPFPATAIRDDQMQTVPVAVSPHTCRLHRSVRQPRHSLVPHFVPHFDADCGTQGETAEHIGDLHIDFVGLMHTFENDREQQFGAFPGHHFDAQERVRCHPRTQNNQCASARRLSGVVPRRPFASDKFVGTFVGMRSPHSAVIPNWPLPTSR